MERIEFLPAPGFTEQTRSFFLDTPLEKEGRSEFHVYQNSRSSALSSLGVSEGDVRASGHKSRIGTKATFVTGLTMSCLSAHLVKKGADGVDKTGQILKYCIFICFFFSLHQD